MSLPVRYYLEEATGKEVSARLTVLYEKAFRIASYNQTLSADTLDEKQRLILHKYRLVPGIDRMPPLVYKTLRRTIDQLETRARRMAA